MRRCAGLMWGCDVHGVPVRPFQAAKAACEQMNQRLAPYRADGKAWIDVLTDANNADVNLSVHYL